MLESVVIPINIDNNEMNQNQVSNNNYEPIVRRTFVISSFALITFAIFSFCVIALDLMPSHSLNREILSISSAEKAEINQYSKMGYVAINRELRKVKGKIDAIQDPEIKRRAKVIRDGLDNWIEEGHNYQGIAYRGQFLSNTVLEQLEEEKLKIFQFGSFTSASTDINTAIFFAGLTRGINTDRSAVIFVIDVYRAAEISGLSEYDNEEEVVLLPQTKYEVLRVSKDEESGYPMIHLKQLQPKIGNLSADLLT